MIQRKSKQKRTNFSLLPSDDPITMRDKYDSFCDQFLYEFDFDQPSERTTNDLEKVTVCAVWPRPRFMLQINAPPKGNNQSFYQNQLNLVPMINRNQTYVPMNYQKKKVHSIKNEDNFNLLNLSKSNSQNNFIQSSNQIPNELDLGSIRQGDQSYPIPKFQIDTTHISSKNQNSAEFLPLSQNNTINIPQNRNLLTSDQISQSQDIKNEGNRSFSDHTSIITTSKSQPRLKYQNQTQKQVKSQIIQHPLNITEIQFAFQQTEQLMKLSPFQQIQNIQSGNRNQIPKQVPTQNPNKNEIGAKDETIKIINEAEMENINQNMQLIQNDPNSQKKKKSKPRQSFTPEQKMLLEKFIYDHIDHPYAEHDDLVMLEKQTNLTQKQIRVFLTNTRMRKFAGNKIPVLKKSGNIVMRKGVPLHGPLGRVDPKNQCLIQGFTKKMNMMKMPMNMQIQSESSNQYHKKNEHENEALKRSNSK